MSTNGAGGAVNQIGSSQTKVNFDIQKAAQDIAYNQQLRDSVQFNESAFSELTQQGQDVAKEILTDFRAKPLHGGDWLSILDENGLMVADREMYETLTKEVNDMVQIHNGDDENSYVVYYDSDADGEFDRYANVNEKTGIIENGFIDEESDNKEEIGTIITDMKGNIIGVDATIPEIGLEKYSEYHRENDDFRIEISEEDGTRIAEEYSDGVYTYSADYNDDWEPDYFRQQKGLPKNHELA